MKTRHKRIAFIVFGLVGLEHRGFPGNQRLQKQSGLLLQSFADRREGSALIGKNFRIGGLVEKGSMKRDSDGLTVKFSVTDTAKSIPVVYKGILPDLFKEGRGCVAQGQVGSDGVFYADQVLAKHDENYMPPEAGQAIDKAKA